MKDYMSLFERAKLFILAHHRRKTWYRILSMMGIVVVFVTTYMLILPAVTMESGQLICTQAEHVHSQQCYTEKYVFTCGQDESSGHQHTKSCVKKVNALTCDMQEHYHSAACYAQGDGELTGTPGTTDGEVVIDNTPEQQEFPEISFDEGNTVSEKESETETEKATEQYFCGLEAHTHTDECFDEEGKLICEKQEHVHTSDCLVKETESEINTEEVTEAVSEVVTEATTESETDTEAISEAITESETDTEAVSEEVTEAVSEAITEAITESETDTEAAREGITEALSEVITEATTESETDTEIASEEIIEAVSEATAESETDTETVSEEVTEAVSEATTESETDTEATTESWLNNFWSFWGMEEGPGFEEPDGSGFKLGTGLKPKTDTEAVTEEATEAESESETITEALTEEVSEAESESEMTTEALTEEVSEKETENATEDASEVDSEALTEDVSEAETEDATEDASEVDIEALTEDTTEDVSEVESEAEIIEIPICTLEEHTHTDECRSEDGQLICGKEEHEHTEDCVLMVSEDSLVCGMKAHTHDESCYDEEGVLVCELEEHTHTTDCVEAESEDSTEDASEIDSEALTEDASEVDTEDLTEDASETETEALTEEATEAESEPAIVAIQICPLEEHTHTDECRSSDLQLICGKEAHTHTEDCVLLVLEDSLVCGMKAHTHDESCYDEEGVLVCELEEHTHTVDCVYTVDHEGLKDLEENADVWQMNGCLFTVEKEEAFAEIMAISDGSVMDGPSMDEPNMDGSGTGEPSTIGLTGGVDFSDWITGSSVSKNENGSWKPGNSFTDGDQVKVHLDYSIPPGIVDADNKVITYQLPGGVHPLKEERGSVTKDGVTVGSYVIGTDGKITITFNDSFADGASFDGSIEFQGTLVRDDAGEDGQFNFGGSTGTITIVENTQEHDINILKNGTFDERTGKIKYEITVSTTKGTGGPVKVEDYFNDYAASLKDIVGYPGNIKVYKDTYGRKTEVSSRDYTIVKDETNGKFTIEGLPELGENEKYVIEYEADVDKSKITGNGSFTVGNIAGANDKWTWNGVEVSKKMVSKSGSYNADTNEITWTIVVNEDGRDLKGYTLTDTLPDGLELVNDSFSIKNSSGEELYPDWLSPNIGGNSFTLSFPSAGETSITDTYTITYKTKVKDGYKGKITNDADFDHGSEHYDASGEVNVTPRDWNFNKYYQGSEELLKSGKLQWISEATLPSTPIRELEDGKIVYRDNILNATDEEGNDKGSDSHYAVASELDKSFKDAGKLYITDNEGTRYGITNNQHLKFTITYYSGLNCTGDVISPDNSDRPVKSFEIVIEAESNWLDGRLIENNFIGKMLHIEYETHMNVDKMAGGEEWKFTNKAWIGKHEAEASHNYKKPNPLTKYCVEVDEWGNETYNEDNFHMSYDKTNGRLKYRLLLRTGSLTENGDITLTDVLPSGAAYVEGSLKGMYYVNAHYRPESDYQGYDFANGQKPTVTAVQNEDGTTTLTVKIAGGYNDHQSNPAIICIEYEVDISEDPFWKELNRQDAKVYENSVTWGTNTDSHKTTVGKEVDRVEKFAEQMKDASGEPTDEVKYTVIINSHGVDLDSESDTLELTDQLTLPQGVEAYLQLDKLKLYYYSENADEHLGSEMSRSRYQVVYDELTHHMTITLPDATPCVLVYSYLFDRGNVDTPTITNSVELMGKYSEDENHALEHTTSGATVTKTVVKVYKVDEDDYGKRLEGAEFTLSKWIPKHWDETGAEQPGEWVTVREGLTTSADGAIILDNAAMKWESDTLYRLTETKAPKGYTRPENPYTYFVMLKNKTKDDFNSEMESSGVVKDSIRFFSANGGSIYIPNDCTSISVKKLWVDKETGEETDPRMESIEVQLFQHKGSPEEEGIPYDSDDNPIELNAENNWSYTWETLPKDDGSGNTYYYTVKELDEDGNVIENGKPVDDGDTFTVTYRNNKGIEKGEVVVTNKVPPKQLILPETGGPGTIPYTVGGAILTVFSALLLYIKSIRRKEGQSAS